MSERDIESPDEETRRRIFAEVEESPSRGTLLNIVPATHARAEQVCYVVHDSKRSKMSRCRAALTTIVSVIDAPILISSSSSLCHQRRVSGNEYIVIRVTEKRKKRGSGCVSADERLSHSSVLTVCRAATYGPSVPPSESPPPL